MDSMYLSVYLPAYVPTYLYIYQSNLIYVYLCIHAIYASMYQIDQCIKYESNVCNMYSNVMQYYDMLCYARTCAYTCIFTDTYTII